MVIERENKIASQKELAIRETIIKNKYVNN